MCAKLNDEESIFYAALELKSPDERSAYLKRACGDDADLLSRVEALLQVQESEQSALEVAVSSLNVTLGIEPLTEGPGTKIGRYKLLELIGEGGFGVVYMAEQAEPIRRRVALKIIKLGMDTKKVIARFEAERQALAMMEHPNIAKVLDAGATETGRPYFVMELVRGIPVTEYCDKNNLDTHQRLEIFIDVCKAVQHAHQKGIIHRDIKPSNILITLHDDGTPLAKVIDFGIAKATQKSLTEKTLFTEFKQFVGTPEYMSPEQAQMSAVDVDTRSDIYSLGVLLYELLTGRTPLEHKELLSASYDQMLKIIRETEPAKPSACLHTLGDGLAEVAKHRQVEAGELCKIVRGELDWIVLKTLEKDRTRRYETANELVADIQRHLTDEPVVAGPPSAVYRMRKFVRRNRALVTGIAMVLVVLMVGIVASTIFAVGQARARAEAERQRNSAMLARTAEAQQRQRAEANFQMARDAVDEMVNMVEERLAGAPGMEQARSELLQKAQVFYQGFLEKNSSDPTMLNDVQRAYNHLGEVYRMLGQDEDAEQPYREALKVGERLVNDFPDTPGYRLGLAWNHFRLIWLLRDLNRDEEVEELCYRGLDVLEEAARDFPDERIYLDPQAHILSKLADVLTRAERFEEAEQICLEAMMVCEKVVAEFGEEPDSHDSHNTLAHVHRSLGSVFQNTGRLSEAEESYRQAVKIYEKLAADFPTRYRCGNLVNLVNCCDLLGRLLRQVGKADEGELYMRKALAAGEALVTYLPSDYSHQHNVGYFSAEVGELEKALLPFAKAVEINPSRPTSQYFQALIHLAIGVTERYRSTSAKMLERFGQTEKTDEAHWAAWTCVLGPDAIEDLSQMVRLAEELVKSDDKNDQYLATLGAILYRAGRFEEAVEKLSNLVNAWTKTDQYPTRTSPAYTWYFLAMAHHQLGNSDEAKSWFEKGVERSEEEMEGAPSWNRKLTLELLQAEARSLLGISENNSSNQE